jgi:hypothetical protein
MKSGSVTHQTALPVPIMSSCVFNNHNFFNKKLNALTFNRDTCCHLALCARLIIFQVIWCLCVISLILPSRNATKNLYKICLLLQPQLDTGLTFSDNQIGLKVRSHLHARFKQAKTQATAAIVAQSELLPLAPWGLNINIFLSSRRKRAIGISSGSLVSLTLGS